MCVGRNKAQDGADNYLPNIVKLCGKPGTMLFGVTVSGIISAGAAIICALCYGVLGH